MLKNNCTKVSYLFLCNVIVAKMELVHKSFLEVTRKYSRINKKIFQHFMLIQDNYKEVNNIQSM